MNGYQRIFGSGPLTLASGLLWLVLAIWLEDYVKLPVIFSQTMVTQLLFGLLTATALFIIIWSVKSLPPSDRGRKLCVSGAFRYFRHPLYGAFLSCFNLGLAALLNNYIYVIWAVIIHVMSHILIASEEKLMLKEFGEDYKVYCSVTGRFFPRLLSLTRQ